mmetsp:Transcript_123704/g.263735  ORF Transcript_123704/g.263735 Transcript_123704/m.263735 type:complete len:227 (+) Transcript_123704:79-759(+)
MPGFAPAAFILDEDDCPEDPFKGKREKMSLAAGEVPVMKYTEPGMSVTTVEIPGMCDIKIWHNVLFQLMMAQGIVVLRPLGQMIWDKDYYSFFNEMLSEICEIPDSRPMFIICVCKGDIKSLMNTWPAIADVVLATPESKFSFPDVRIGAAPALTATAMRKRCSVDTVRKMITDGLPLDAREAQRVGLVDFVGDVEAELARLIARNCQPQVSNIMYKPDCDKAWKA